MPDNTEFMIAGYVATVVVLAGYVVSLVVRARAMARRGAAIDAAPVQ